MVRAEVHIATQVDWRDFSSSTNGSSDVDIRRARVGVKGAVFQQFEYEIERDFREGQIPWRDAYVNVPVKRALEIRVGRFKVPFSLDQLTGAVELDLVQRSLAAQYLTPGRDVGVMAHGRLLARRIRYQVAAFRGGGDNVRAAERRDPRHGGVVAGRVVFRPWNDSGAPPPLRGLSIGAAVTTGRVPDGEYSLRGHTVSDVPFFPVLGVQGLRRRYGGEIEWRAGPLGVSAEIMRVIDQRLGQSTDDGPLPDIMARGWYVRGTWLLTGEKKSDRVKPAQPFLKGGGGAVEVVARLEDLGLRSRSSDEAAPHARPDALAMEADRAATVGVNWYMNQFLKVQANVVREWRRQGSAPMADGLRTWSPMVRFQFSL